LQGNLSRSLFAKFLIVVIFILISIQAFQIVSVRSAFALTPEQSARYIPEHAIPEENHGLTPGDFKDDEAYARALPPEQGFLQMPH
jgi:hypothetical protein